MDVTRPVACEKDLFNPLSSMGMQMACVLVLSHFFQLVLKPLGHAGPLAQILAGMVLGPSGLSHIKEVNDFFFLASSAEYYELVSMVFRLLFMFVIGLDTDIPYLRRNLRQASILAYGGSIMCCFFGVAISLIVSHQIEVKGSKFALAIVMMFFLATTASPVVVRLAAELKFATTDIGRLAIYSSLINELSCLFMFSVFNGFRRGMVIKGIGLFFLTGSVILANKYLAIQLNRRNRNQKYLTTTEMALFISIVMVPGMFIELSSYNSMVYSFLVGVMFPREGKSARTLLHKLTYCVNTFLLPIFFGYTGFQFNVTYFASIKNAFIILLAVLFSFGGKISGTLAACHYLKIPLNEGLIMAFFLNLRGHGELIIISYAPKYIGWNEWNLVMHNMLIVPIVLNSLIAGPVVAHLVGKERDIFGRRPMALEFHNPDNELRVLACLYGPRHVPAAVGLISALSGSQMAPITPYLMHLVELPEKHKSNLLYHQLEEGDEFSDEEDYGGNEALEINDAVDVFTTDTGILIHQVKAVSSLASLYEDVCNGAEDLLASFVILPFHKHQRIDGKMENGKEGIRGTNQKVIRHAPCSVGIIVDRGLPGVPLLGSETRQDVATLFFGGPDDREALACSKRIATHPHINLTVIRFQEPTSPSSSDEHHDVVTDNASHQDNEILMAISSNETENQIDIAFLTDFFNRYVTSGQVGFVEKYVSNGAQTVTALKDMADMYSLFIVGKGGRGHSPMTTGMSDWEECPELGTVGDLLASADFNISGSVLVIQQHRHTNQDLMDD